MIGGIRFYGQDVARPFVEVIAHDFTDWRALGDCVASEWAAFAPLHLRSLVAPDATLPATAFVDMSIHLARYRDMAPPDGRVSLAPLDDAGTAVEMVAARFADLAETDPALARNVSAARPRVRGLGPTRLGRVAGHRPRPPAGRNDPPAERRLGAHGGAGRTSAGAGPCVPAPGSAGTVLTRARQTPRSGSGQSRASLPTLRVTRSSAASSPSSRARKAPSSASRKSQHCGVGSLS
ncbi:hypothetical protein JAN5088_03089 [Jannaschia rubra]|uniref:Uncharacterized protein n=1 Tax=Jannaschia rubra TaxID=282197 RepID=A0A0M6XW16_9RHOB|nr:hypothetical protein JAN5088_03089 [Jannaschia rubra]SFG18578.1 hypothetical protein SAMN04488517_10348 [Jannaschia rubra]